MKKGLSELIFILDMSGSMSSLTKDTIGGFNSMIEKQKSVEGDANITLICFDHEYELVYDNISIKEIPVLTEEKYCPRGTTALYDAIGRTIDSVGKRLSKTAEEDRPEKVIVSITTDGHENASNDYSHNKIKEMIEHQQEKYNWEFIFLGADVTSTQFATNIGINPDFVATWTTSSAGMASHTKGMSTVMSNMRSADYTRDASNEVYKNVVAALNSIDITNSTK